MPEPGVPYDPTDPNGERSYVTRVEARKVQPDLSGGVSFAEREGVFYDVWPCRIPTVP